MTGLANPFRTRISRRGFVAATAATLTLGLAGVAFGQSGGGYDLSWSKITGGGGSSAGGSYGLTASIGQPLAGQVQGSGYVIDSGFWGGAAMEAFFKAWAPGLERNP